MTDGSREMRFSGGPLHGEVRKMREPLLRVFRVPVSDFYDPAAFVQDIPVSEPAFRVAEYELAGDYPVEYFYRFARIDRSRHELLPARY